MFKPVSTGPPARTQCAPSRFQRARRLAHCKYFAPLALGKECRIETSLVLPKRETVKLLQTLRRPSRALCPCGNSATTPWLASKLLKLIIQLRKIVNKGSIAQERGNQCLRFKHAKAAKQTVFPNGTNDAGNIPPGLGGCRRMILESDSPRAPGCDKCHCAQLRREEIAAREKAGILEDGGRFASHPLKTAGQEAAA